MPILSAPDKAARHLSGPTDSAYTYLQSQRQFFHKMRKDFQQVRRFFASPAMMKAARSPYKTYEGTKLFPLSGQLLGRLEGIPFSQVLWNRRTRRVFADGSLRRHELDTLVLLAAGERRSQGLPHEASENPKRFVLSGGGLYPLECYFMNLRVEGLPRGLFHFHPGKNAFEHLRTETLPLADLYQDRQIIDQEDKVSGVFFFTAMIERNRIKYGNRVARFVYLDAGHVSQNLALGASALDLLYWPQGATNETHLAPYLKIDGISEAIVHTALIGYGEGSVRRNSEVGFVNKMKQLLGGWKKF